MDNERKPVEGGIKYMSYKRLIPCCFYCRGKAVRWFDDPTVISEDVIGLAKYYSSHGADELLVFGSF